MVDGQRKLNGSVSCTKVEYRRTHTRSATKEVRGIVEVREETPTRHLEESEPESKGGGVSLFVSMFTSSS